MHLPQCQKKLKPELGSVITFIPRQWRCVTFHNIICIWGSHRGDSISFPTLQYCRENNYPIISWHFLLCVKLGKCSFKTQNTVFIREELLELLMGPLWLRVLQRYLEEVQVTNHINFRWNSLQIHVTQYSKIYESLPGF